MKIKKVKTDEDKIKFNRKVLLSLISVRRGRERGAPITAARY